LVEFKEGENIALTLHFVQPQEYIEYFEDLNLSLTQQIGQIGHLWMGTH